MSIWPSHEGRSTANGPTQRLYDRAAELRSLLKSFNGASWPFLGSGFGLVDKSVKGIDRVLETLCVELTSRRSGAVYANQTQLEPGQWERDWLARVHKLSNGVARLPQVAGLLTELRPKAATLRAACLELIEKAPTAPLPLLSAAKTAIVRLDYWLDAQPICDELNRLRTECEALRVVAEMMGADEVASRARRAVEALPPVPQEDRS